MKHHYLTPYMYALFLGGLVLLPLAAAAQTFSGNGVRGRGNQQCVIEAAAKMQQLEALEAKLSGITACQSKGLFYAPGNAKADGDGCVPPLAPAHEWLVNNLAGTVQVRFEQPDGSWGGWSADLRGPKGADAPACP